MKTNKLINYVGFFSLPDDDYNCNIDIMVEIVRSSTKEGVESIIDYLKSIDAWKLSSLEFDTTILHVEQIIPKFNCKSYKKEQLDNWFKYFNQCLFDDTTSIRVNYKQYIRSRAWELRKATLYRFRGQECESCGSDSELSIHHNDYGNLGCEEPNNLRIQCKTRHEIADENRKWKKGFESWLEGAAARCGLDANYLSELQIDSFKEEFNNFIGWDRL
jgi:hypothetical protein